MPEEESRRPNSLLLCSGINHRKFLQLAEKRDLHVYYKGDVVIEIIANF